MDDTATLEGATIQRLVDEQGIRDTIGRYAEAVSRMDVDSFGALFTEDAVWDVPPPLNMRATGREEIKETLRSRWEKADREFVFFFIGAITIESIDGARAKTRTQVQEFARARGRHTGFVQLATYLDDLVKIDERWFFSRRTLHPVYIDFELLLPGRSFENQLGPIA